MSAGGKIEYSLGLATAGFLGPLRSVTAGLAGFIGLAGGLGGAAAGVFNEINRGGALKDLSNRTGELVGDLFQLQFAFEQSGVSAATLPTVLQKYRASLSGVGEMGESTAEAFSLIGTNIDALKKLDAPAALDAIFGGLNKLDRNTAAGVAAKIFGRGASGDILQLARDAEGFAEALGESAKQAALFQANADAFDRIGDTIGNIKLELRGVFATIASDITPALQAMFDAVKGRDFETMGEVARLSLTVGFGEAVNFLSRSLQAVFAAMPGMMAATASTGGSIGESLVAAAADFWSSRLMGDASGMAVGDPLREQKNKEAALYAELADELRGEAAGSLKTAIAQAAGGIAAAIKTDFVDVIDMSGSKAELAEFTKRFGAVAGVAPGAGGLAAAASIGGGGEKLTQANALERVGALFGSSGNSLTDHARQTAANTRESSKTLYKVSAVLERMERQSTGGFANV